MTWSRREVLASLGVASAQTLLWACGAPAKKGPRQPTELDPHFHSWLREAVATLRGAGFAAVHVLAVSRERATGAIDVLGAGVARGRCDGLVLSVRGKDGMLREHVGNDLSRDGIAAAVKVLAGSAKPAAVQFGRPPPALLPLKPDPRLLPDGQLLARVGAIAMRDHDVSSRIVYSAAVIDIDDATVYSIAPGRDVVQRLVRVRQSLTRVAWNGTQPVVSEASRAWLGGIDDDELSQAEIIAAKENALTLMTPRAFEDGDHAFALEPAVAAMLIDASVRALMTSSAVTRPEVAHRLAVGVRAAAPILTLSDDPAAPRAYGGFQFDDAGTPAAPVMLLDKGQVVGRLDDNGRSRRPGHVGCIEAAPSHLRLAAGTVEEMELLDDGFMLEGPVGIVLDPASDRVVISVARARERVAGKRTGRVYADIELVGELGKLLGSVSALSKQVYSIGMRDEVAGQPRWRSVETPWVRGRGKLRARRRVS